MNQLPADQGQLNLWLWISAYGLLASPMSDSGKMRVLEPQIKRMLQEGVALPSAPQTGVAIFDNAIATYLNQLRNAPQQAQTSPQQAQPASQPAPAPEQQQAQPVATGGSTGGDQQGAPAAPTTNQGGNVGG